MKQLYLLFLVEKCVGCAVIWLSLTCFHSQGRHEWPPEFRARISPECQGNMAAYLAWPVDNRCWCGEYWCKVKTVIQFHLAIWRNGDNCKSSSLWVESSGFQDKEMLCNTNLSSLFLTKHFRAVCDLTIGLVSSQTMDTSYSSKTVYCSDYRCHHQQPKKEESSDSVQSPISKKKKVEHSQPLTDLQQLSPGNQTRLTAVCSLPRFTLSDRCPMSVVMTWRSYHGNGSIEQHSMHCGHVTLCAAQVMDGSLQVSRNLDSKSFHQDIAALRSVSIETEVMLLQLIFNASFLNQRIIQWWSLCQDITPKRAVISQRQEGWLVPLFFYQDWWGFYFPSPNFPQKKTNSTPHVFQNPLTLPTLSLNFWSSHS